MRSGSLASPPCTPRPQVEHALWLVREALASGYDLPTAAYNHLLQVGGCWECGLGQVAGSVVWGRVLGVWFGQMLRLLGGKPSSPVWVTTRSMQAEHRAPLQPAQLPASPPKLPMPPTHSRCPCSAPLPQLLAGRGEWERALAVHRAMNLAAGRPDSTTAGLLVAACVHGGNQQLASQLAAVRGGGGGGRCNTLAGLYTAFAVIERAGVG